MPEIFDSLADLTAFRDRDVIDVTLVTAVRDILQPLALGMYRPVGEPGEEAWSTRARMSANSRVAAADPLWKDVQNLPRLQEHAARYQAYTTQQVVQLSGEPHRSLFPLATDREVLGVLEIETEQPLTNQQQRVVHSVLRIYRNFLGLLDYSERDTLTGLLNRKTFDEAFLKALAAMAPLASAQSAAASDLAEGVDARRLAGQGGFWLGVIDIDHFKRVNDGHGHLIGDEVLLLLARLLRSSFRGHDLLFRFGGEEFVVLVRCDRSADAALAFERLRSNTADFEFPQVGHITVSVGYTQVAALDTPSAAFERADKAVYYAKAHGRNQVHSFADLVARGALTLDAPKGGEVELF